MAFLVGLLCVTFSTTARADKLVLVAGTGTADPSGVAATQTKLDGPFGVDWDAAGNLFMVEISGHRVMKVDKAGLLTKIGGTGEKGGSGDGGPAMAAQFNGMHSLAIGKGDEIYVADTWNARVRKIDPKTGIITAFAGTGKKGDSGEGGPATSAEFGDIYCIALDPAKEKLYLTDLDKRRIRVVDLKTGIVTNAAGNGEKGVPKDGADAKTSPLVDPRAATVDAKGNLYILERGGHALRIVDSAGKIRTVVGTGMKGSSGDGGDALAATMNGPKHLCIDRDGSVIIADTENHMIRRYIPATGKIVRIAGTGKKGTAGVGGDPLQAEFAQPHGVMIHADGTLYITDSGNHRVLKIER